VTITPDELTRLRQYQAEAMQASEKAGDYQRYLSKRCNHPADWVERVPGSFWSSVYSRCTLCSMVRYWGEGVWFAPKRLIEGDE